MYQTLSTRYLYRLFIGMRDLSNSGRAVEAGKTSALPVSRRNVLKATGGLGIAGLAGCTALLDDEGEMAVGSKDFTEQHVLGHLAINALEAEGFDVIDETGLAGTGANWDALTEGETDIYWEYTGTMWLAIFGEEEVIADAEELYEACKERMDEDHDIAVLDRAPLNNTYQITANEDWWDEHDIETLSELAEYANDQNAEDITPVLGPEFQEREDDGWPALLDHYGFTEEAQEALNGNIVTVDEDVVYSAVGEEAQGDIGMGFATDPRIPLFNLQIFEDDENFFPIYNAAPMVRNDTLDEHPEIADALNPISPLLDDDTIADLNMAVAEEGRDVSNATEEFLEENGLI